MITHCPLEKTCSKLQCDAIKLVEWQAKHSSDDVKLAQLASRVATFHCKR